ncbi:glutamate transport system permease protein [Propionibacterium cyclohexanicum]|uniref:Glutamate transport system permease protein n=1 Tax=Propionibacterium cyclohexanicum TaxID=64702 RepID=A0A1H9Q7S8_9ACTN|nr:amino acid ABC transporter permease [Propionibacterium cyclohexanicum]SER56490.1 glutamate transport system permease protein [Propionibacterium cyclohexanicum]
MSTQPSQRILFDEPGPRGRRTIALATVAVALLIIALVIVVLAQLDAHDQLEPQKWFFFTQPGFATYMAYGIVGTFRATLVAAVFAFPFGLLLALGRLTRQPLVHAVCVGWVEFFRSIPMLLVVYAFLLALPSYGLNLDIYWKLVIPMILVNSATTAEVFRAGILAVEKGQSEAAQSLGMSARMTMALVVLPQALRLVLPNLLTQLVSLLKDSTLGYVVSYPELMERGRILTSYTHYLLQTYTIVAVIYVLLNFGLTRLAGYLQSRGNRKSAGHRGSRTELAATTMA